MPDGTPAAARAEDLARRASDWLVDQLPRDPADPSVYHGLAGAAMALFEAYRHFGDERYGAAAQQRAEVLSTMIDDLEDCSLYFGLTGIALVLQALGRDSDVQRALGRIRAGFDGTRWNAMFELFMGNAGIGVGALQVGDLDLAQLAVEPYLRTADPTPDGVNWAVRPSPPRSHHMAHGTFGIVYALADGGAAPQPPDLTDLALAGAADVVGRNEGGADGFLVPHSDPPHRPELIERYSFGWCNGPAGDAQLFRLLLRITGDSCWATLADRCWTSVTRSGLPRRLFPGFWDNSGRCCGTAGVLTLALDRIVEQGDGIGFAGRLVDDLAARATVDGTGARWSNREHRAMPQNLPPDTGWAMGNAGILRELLRYARVLAGRAPDYAIPWPDHLPVPLAEPARPGSVIHR